MTGPRRLRRLGILVALAPVLGVFGVTPALAESRQVRVSDNVFSAPGVAVKPGESVTWSLPTITDHHNVHFEDESFTGPGEQPEFGPWEVSRSFEEEGTFRYFCQEHGGDGGQGMSGIVYVNKTATVPGAAPTAAFAVSPGVVGRNQEVAFDASASTDPEGSIIRREWDLDGDGKYELDTGEIPSTSRSYSSAGTRTVKLRVTDSQMHVDETTQTVRVTNEPAAALTVSPNPAQTGQAVSFDGSASSDADGTIAKYEWDLDGDGSFETDTGTTPTTSRSFSSPGARSVKLRVTDDLGVSSETSQSFQVNAAPPSPSGRSAPAACASLKGARRVRCAQKRCRRLKAGKRAACVARSCRHLARGRRAASRGKRAACMRRSCRYVKQSGRTSCRRKSCRVFKGAKKEACARKYRPERSKARRRKR